MPVEQITDLAPDKAAERVLAQWLDSQRLVHLCAADQGWILDYSIDRAPRADSGSTLYETTFSVLPAPTQYDNWIGSGVLDPHSPWILRKTIFFSVEVADGRAEFVAKGTSP